MYFKTCTRYPSCLQPRLPVHSITGNKLILIQEQLGKLSLAMSGFTFSPQTLVSSIKFQLAVGKKKSRILDNWKDFKILAHDTV